MIEDYFMSNFGTETAKNPLAAPKHNFMSYKQLSSVVSKRKSTRGTFSDRLTMLEDDIDSLEEPHLCVLKMSN